MLFNFIIFLAVYFYVKLMVSSLSGYSDNDNFGSLWFYYVGAY